jgi:MFS family permease
MADISEKNEDTVVQHEDPALDKQNIASTRMMLGDDNFAQAMIKEPPMPWNFIATQLYLFSVVGFFCSTSNGFDSSLFGTLLDNKTFTAFMDVGNVGIGAGIVTSMSQIGGVAALPFIGPAIDTWGRRGGMFIGGLIIVVGVIIQGTCVANHNVHQFMGGRFFMGMGVNIISASGPTYCVEISHPAYRGTVTAIYNVFW